MTIRSAATAALIILVLASSWRIEASAKPSAIVYVDMSDSVPVTTRASDGETVRLVVYGSGCRASRYDSPPAINGALIEFTLAISAACWATPPGFGWSADLPPLPSGTTYTIRYRLVRTFEGASVDELFVRTQLLAIGPRPARSEDARAGVPDPSFGTGGVARVPVPGFFNEPVSIARQAGGGVVVGARSASGFGVTRLLDTGAVDGTFAVDGTLDTRRTLSGMEAMTTGVNDEIAFAGGSFLNGTPHFALARYSGDGVPTSAVSVPMDLQGAVPKILYPHATAVALQAGGRIVVAGTASDRGTYDCVVNWDIFRYDAVGTLDAAFAANGVYRGGFAGCVYRMTATKSGGLLVLGSVTATGEMFLLALDANGHAVASFGDRGMVFGAFAFSAPIVRGDGKILVGLRDFSATRLNSDGSVDTTFADHGVLRNQTGVPLILQDIVEQDDGRMLLVGAQLVRSGDSSNPFMAWYRPVLARYTGDGKLDHSFADQGTSAVGLQLFSDLDGPIQGMALLPLPGGTTALAMPDSRGLSGGGALAAYRFEDGSRPSNYQGLWWNPAESGWGISFAHQGDTILATWFTFDLDGSPLWMVVAAHMTAPNVYSGTLYRGTGPAFNATPFAPSQVVGTPVGSATFTFNGNDDATFAYDIGGVVQTKRIARQVFASPVPACTWGAPLDPSLATNYQDLWWNAPAGSESGWGINFTHQGDTIFATWFTFGLDGKPLWLVVSASLVSPKVYSGTMYTGTGPAFNAIPFEPTKVVGTPVGTATFTFADGNNAIFAYTVNGVSQTKPITREIISAPGTICQ